MLDLGAFYALKVKSSLKVTQSLPTRFIKYLCLSLLLRALINFVFRIK
jgi:hypothetical protein